MDKRYLDIRSAESIKTTGRYEPRDNREKREGERGERREAPDRKQLLAQVTKLVERSRELSREGKGGREGQGVREKSVGKSGR